METHVSDKVVFAIKREAFLRPLRLRTKNALATEELAADEPAPEEGGEEKSEFVIEMICETKAEGILQWFQHFGFNVVKKDFIHMNDRVISALNEMKEDDILYNVGEAAKQDGILLITVQHCNAMEVITRLMTSNEALDEHALTSVQDNKENVEAREEQETKSEENASNPEIEKKKPSILPDLFKKHLFANIFNLNEDPIIIMPSNDIENTQLLQLYTIHKTSEQTNQAVVIFNQQPQFHHISSLLSISLVTQLSDPISNKTAYILEAEHIFEKLFLYQHLHPDSMQYFSHNNHQYLRDLDIYFHDYFTASPSSPTQLSILDPGAQSYKEFVKSLVDLCYDKPGSSKALTVLAESLKKQEVEVVEQEKEVEQVLIDRKVHVILASFSEEITLTLMSCCDKLGYRFISLYKSGVEKESVLKRIAEFSDGLTVCLGSALSIEHIFGDIKENISSGSFCVSSSFELGLSFNEYFMNLGSFKLLDNTKLCKEALIDVLKTHIVVSTSEGLSIDGIVQEGVYGLSNGGRKYVSVCGKVKKMEYTNNKMLDEVFESKLDCLEEYMKKHNDICVKLKTCYGSEFQREMLVHRFSQRCHIRFQKKLNSQRVCVVCCESLNNDIVKCFLTLEHRSMCVTQAHDAEMMLEIIERGAHIDHFFFLFEGFPSFLSEFECLSIDLTKVYLTSNTALRDSELKVLQNRWVLLDDPAQWTAPKQVDPSEFELVLALDTLEDLVVQNFCAMLYGHQEVAQQMSRLKPVSVNRRILLCGLFQGCVDDDEKLARILEVEQKTRSRIKLLDVPTSAPEGLGEKVLQYLRLN